jgi:hypothetical protein
LFGILIELWNLCAGTGLLDLASHISDERVAETRAISLLARARQMLDEQQHALPA